MRNTAARIGLPNRTRKVCSATRPTRPTGMVARMIIQARISSRVATRGCHRCQCASEVKKPPMIRTQSRQK